MAKRILIIEPDGAERELPADKLPVYRTMKEIVGGSVELVRVLRQDITDRNAYTYMAVNESGLIDGLPRNQRATDLYLGNVRRAFPTVENPSKAAAESYRREMEAHGFTIIETDSSSDEDPHICGPVIWFDGWTCDELTEAGL